MNKFLAAFLLVMSCGGALVQAAPKAVPVPTLTPLHYTLEDSTGEVTVLRSEQTKTTRLNVGDIVSEGDEVRVGAGGEATLFLDEDTIVHLGPKSELKVGKLQANENGGFLNRLQLLAGRVLSEVKNLARARSSFEVESGGVICGVRGTAFEVERVGERVETATYEGEVEVKAGDALERVKKGYRYAFQKNRVHLKRRLDRTEKDRFEKWMKHHKDLREKRIKRLKALKAKTKKRQIKRSPQRREKR